MTRVGITAGAVVGFACEHRRRAGDGVTTASEPHDPLDEVQASIGLCVVHRGRCGRARIAWQHPQDASSLA